LTVVGDFRAAEKFYKGGTMKWSNGGERIDLVQRAKVGKITDRVSIGTEGV